MSAAVVSGVAALLLEEHRNWTPDQVKAALVRTARNVPGAGAEVDAEAAVRAVVARGDAVQSFPVSSLIDPATGAIDYAGASWRGASWRGVDVDSPLSASFAAASWRCDCSLAPDGSVEPAAASWRAASWRTSFNK
jgi:subtilisin family serine protease